MYWLEAYGLYLASVDMPVTDTRLRREAGIPKPGSLANRDHPRSGSGDDYYS
jgi:hypothetical protein